MQSESLANGPEGRTVWDFVDWRKASRIVTNLRQRIFRAARANDHRKVRSLQKLMLRSRSNILMSVRRVTQVNQPFQHGLMITIITVMTVAMATDYLLTM